MPLTAAGPWPRGLWRHGPPLLASGSQRAQTGGAHGEHRSLCFSSFWPLASAPGDLHDQNPSNIPLLPLKLRIPLYGEATDSFYSPRGEAAIPRAPSPSPQLWGTGEAPRGCLGPALSLLSAPPASSSLAAPAPG